MPGLTIFGCLISSRGLCARLAASAAPTCGRVRAVHAERQGSVRLAMAGETDMQLFFYALILFGAIVGAVGGFGSSIYKDRSAQRDKAAQQKTINDLTAQVAKFEAVLNKNTEVILAS